MPELLTAAAYRVALRTLGCKVNRAESEAIATQLLGKGTVMVDEVEADVIVVNTCTVTGEADAKARKAVRHCLAAPGAPVVVVTGCLAVLDAPGLRSLGERVVVEADKERVAAAVLEALGAGGRPVAGPTSPRAASHAEAPNAFRTRVAVKIEDGCDNFCTYCIVPIARGLPRATPLAAIVADVTVLVAAGTREVVLTGINIGRYRDEASGADLADVLRAVAATGVGRVRLSSVEPPDLTQELLGAMAETPAFCAHLHLPLQAGSDPVLEAMGRTYGVAAYADRVGAARAALPGLVVTTDVIAGFPGETAEQAAETLAFCEEIGFGKLHVFRYSRRAGTPAAERSDQVPDAEKSRRAAALRELSERAVRGHARARIGDVAEVLVERVAPDPRAGTLLAIGTTRDHLRVRFSAGEVAVGELVDVRLTDVDGDVVLGERP